MILGLTLSPWEFVMILPETRSHAPTRVAPIPEYSAAISCLTSPLLTTHRLSTPNQNLQQQLNVIIISSSKRIQYFLTTYRCLGLYQLPPDITQGLGLGLDDLTILPLKEPSMEQLEQGIGLSLNDLAILRTRNNLLKETFNLGPERPNLLQLFN